MVNWHMSDNVRLELAYGYGSLNRFGIAGIPDRHRLTWRAQNGGELQVLAQDFWVLFANVLLLSCERRRMYPACVATSDRASR
ncbi:MAG TPA: hypothetical protein VLV86_24635 [Vicinamibacterales bacterium]|nr:hypothetical protein [Vicinamibacterales bacterium]